MIARNPLQELKMHGQKVWLDLLSQELISSGRLQRLITEAGVSGVTSNPAIFKEAITSGTSYDSAIQRLVEQGSEVAGIYQAIVIKDIQQAADLLRPIFDQSGGRDGFVSLEVSPLLAHDTKGTVQEARELWSLVQRPNLLIKVPGTEAGIPAIRELIAAGLNINVTLLFSLERYQTVAQAYLSGLQERRETGLMIDHVRSVASFFLSRIDALVDEQLDQLIEAGGPKAEQARQIRGQTAIAYAKQAYQMYKQIFSGDEFNKLLCYGAHPQSLLWASTSTKDPTYSDVKYVEALIGPETINTMPLATLEAYQDHGQPAARLETDLGESYRTLSRLSDLGIDLDDIAVQLETEGVQKFSDPHAETLQALDRYRQRFGVSVSVLP